MDQAQDLQELFDSEAEQMTIGALMKAPETMDDIAAIVSEADFYHHQHTILFGIAKTLHEQNKFDFNTLRQWLKEKELLESVGGLEYIAQLKLSLPTLGLVQYYAEKIRDQAIKRRGLQLSRDIEQLTTATEFETIDEYISAISGKFSNLEMNKKGNIVLLRDVITNHIDAKLSGKPKRSPIIGLSDVDRWMNGIGRDRLIIVAGRPGTGKTALSLKIARNVAAQEYGPVPVFSLEMSKEELIDRVLSDLSGVPFSQISRCEEQSEVERSRLMEAADKLYHLPLYIDDSMRMDMPYISAQCRKLKREHGQLGAVVIDYLGLLETHKRKDENKSDAIGRITKECKNLARELGCSIFLLSQMNREIDKRSTKRPVLSDLRDSGNIEQDADMVIFLHRDDEKSTAAIAHVDFIVAKGRQTGMNDFELAFFGQIQRITMMVRQ